MSVDRISDMTHQELEAFVVDIVLKYSPNWQSQNIQLTNKQEVTQFLAVMRANIIETKPGDPTPTQMLIEERDQWYKP